MRTGFVVLLALGVAACGDADAPDTPPVPHYGSIGTWHGQLPGLEVRFVIESDSARAEADREKLERMEAYARSARCRWRVLCEYFGEEETGEPCGVCDNFPEGAGEVGRGTSYRAPRTLIWYHTAPSW